MSVIAANPYVVLPSQESIDSHFKGKRVSEIQTPHLIVDRARFVKNCQKMKGAVERLGWDFRAHIKTHKTAEGARLQCQETGTGRIIVSTIPEALIVLQAGLVSDGTVKDMLYSMPLPLGLVEPLYKIKAEMAKHGAMFRLMIDNPAQIKGLEQAMKASGRSGEVWSIYLKLDIGSLRAGLPPSSDSMAELIRTALSSPTVSVFGTYTHANFSYASKDALRASECLAQELRAANEAATLVLKIAEELGPSVLSEVKQAGLRLAVGATPTANAAGPEWEEERKKAGVAKEQLAGTVELHAGNYCLLDTQQCATSLVQQDACAMSVGAVVISTYPDRKEALCDAGAICMSKDTGPIPGYGPVVAPEQLEGWHLTRTSQEHGILGQVEGASPKAAPAIGDYVRLNPQHACLTAAQHPWFLIVEGDDIVKDIWIPCRGW